MIFAKFLLLFGSFLGVLCAPPPTELSSARPILDLAALLNHPCPVASVIHPCKCTAPDPLEKNVDLICEDIHYAMGSNIEDIFYNFKDTMVNELQIHQSSLKELSGRIFRHLDVSRLHLTNVDYQRVSFYDDFNSPSKLAKTLYKIHVERAKDIGQWDWSGFETLKSLSTLYIEDSPLTRITKSFSALPDSITDLSFTRMRNLSSIAEGALARLHNLEDLKISGTMLKTFERNALPTPATKLVRLVLSGNQIETLPGNFFDQMPALKVLDLKGNKLKTLVPSTFKPITTQIDILLLEDNPYLCNCLMAWLIDMDKSKFRGNFDLFCAEPSNLVNERLLNLLSEDFVCDHVAYSNVNETTPAVPKKGSHEPPFFWKKMIAKDEE